MSTAIRRPIQIIVANKLAVMKAGLPSGAKQFLREKQFTSNSEYTPVKPSSSGLKGRKTTKILD